MKRRSDDTGNSMQNLFSNSAVVLSVLVAGFSLIVVLFRLTDRLALIDFVLGIATAVTGVIAGIYSVQIVRIAKHFRRTPRVLLSYSHDNKEMVSKVIEGLHSTGAYVWIDEEQPSPEDQIYPAIEEAIKESDSFVVIFSKEPTLNLSHEIRIAQANNIPIVAVTSAEGRVPTELSAIRHFRIGEDSSFNFTEYIQTAIKPS